MKRAFLHSTNFRVYYIIVKINKKMRWYVQAIICFCLLILSKNILPFLSLILIFFYNPKINMQLCYYSNSIINSQMLI